MDIFVYSDESGVFDKAHNNIFVFGGLILLGSAEKEKWSRLYSKAERDLRARLKAGSGTELKASYINNAEKGKMFRSLNNCHKFSVTINEQMVLDRIFLSKKDKQRYLDFAYKIAVKRAFESLIRNRSIRPEDVSSITFNVDEHTTATNGKYELCQTLEQEFKLGTYNYNYAKFYPPIFPDVHSVNVNYCNSAKQLLVRAADIVANHVFYRSIKGDYDHIKAVKNMNHIILP